MKLISVFKTPIIEFLCEEKYLNVAPSPQPAFKNIPEWYKKIPPFVKGNRDPHGKPAMSAKKCLPMLDAMSIGFTIPLAGDQHLRVNDDCSQIHVSPTTTQFDKLIEFHSIDQVGGKGGAFGITPPIKFINPWVVKTPPGWSCLFIPPINSLEDRFLCLGGLVDTDKYPKQVNFPAKWLKPDYDDYLEAGTPLVTAIPIKRSTLIENYSVRNLDEKEIKEIDRIRRCQDSRSHYYTNELRVKR